MLRQVMLGRVCRRRYRRGQGPRQQAATAECLGATGQPWSAVPLPHACRLSRQPGVGAHRAHLHQVAQSHAPATDHLAPDAQRQGRRGGRWIPIRTQPAQGVEVRHALFAAAVEAARQRRCRWLKIETQNTNVPACRFYARQGCELRGIHRGMYAAFPEELQLLWYYDL